MLLYVAKRITQLVPVIIGITLLCFFLLRLLPGDPATLLLGARGGEEEIAALRAELDLDRPLVEQYLGFLRDMVTGSFGTSIAFRASVASLVFERLPATLALVGLSTLLAVALTVPLALLAAVRRGGPADFAIRAVLTAVLAMPQFWLGLVLVIVFAIKVPLFPTGGFGDGVLDNLHHLFLPALVIALGTTALTAQNLRSNLIAVLRADYIDTARAKGLREGVVLRRHVLPNSLISAISVLGVHTSWIIGGTVVIEAVFSLPGVGLLLVNSIYARDYPMVQGITVIFAVLVVLINLLTDLAYAAADPRVRLSQ